MSFIVTREYAQELIDNCLSVLDDCPQCEHFSYAEHKTAVEADWEHCTHRNGYLKRCAKCKVTQMFPWAAGLSVDRVRDWLQAREDRGERSAFFITDLKALLH